MGPHFLRPIRPIAILATAPCGFAVVAVGAAGSVVADMFSVAAAVAAAVVAGPSVDLVAVAVQFRSRWDSLDYHRYFYYYKSSEQEQQQR